MPEEIPLKFDYIACDQMLKNSENFRQKIQSRRSVRDFSEKTFDKKILENCIMAASTAPSGANKQPYEFVIVENSTVKAKIRCAAEEEERAFYGGRASEKWLKDLEPLNTNDSKPFLEKVPFLVAVFSKPYDIIDGEKKHNYYTQESTGLAVGTLITALHISGLACLTHTPSPMKFLNQILDMPSHYKPFLLLVVGFPADKVKVPNIFRKEFGQLACYR